MIYLVFSIYDSKAEAFLPPFILPKKAMALRTFSDCVNSDSHQFGSNPEDYTLFELGSFNDESGQYLLHRTVISCGNGLEFQQLGAAQATEGRSNGRSKPETDAVEQALADVAPIQSGTTSEDSA
ncbi:nonstructural protein [Microviridae sp.]|nr:nonstructural protein [Microviridae sp.]